jgi:hypothetical protein
VQFFTLIYDFLQEQASKGGPFSGALFWNAAIGKEELFQFASLLPGRKGLESEFRGALINMTGWKDLFSLRLCLHLRSSEIDAIPVFALL